jgi:hypothetical protein
MVKEVIQDQFIVRPWERQKISIFIVSQKSKHNLFGILCEIIASNLNWHETQKNEETCKKPVFESKTGVFVSFISYKIAGIRSIPYSVFHMKLSREIQIIIFSKFSSRLKFWLKFWLKVSVMNSECRALIYCNGVIHQWSQQVWVSFNFFRFDVTKSFSSAFGKRWSL